MLLAFVDEHIADGETTYSEIEGWLVANLLQAMQTTVQGQDLMSWKMLMEDRRVKANLDCLWWFRFLIASRPEDAQADLTNSPT